MQDAPLLHRLVVSLPRFIAGIAATAAALTKLHKFASASYAAFVPEDLQAAARGHRISSPGEARSRGEAYASDMNVETDATIAEEHIGDADIVFAGEAARVHGEAHRAAGGTVAAVKLTGAAAKAVERAQERLRQQPR